MAREALALHLHGIHELGLPRRARGVASIERTCVPEAATAQLCDLRVVSCVEGGEPPAPAHRLRVIAIAPLARGQDRPDGMELAVLAEQVPVAQRSGVEIPDAHGAMVARVIGVRANEWAGAARG